MTRTILFIVAVLVTAYARHSDGAPTVTAPKFVSAVYAPPAKYPVLAGLRGAHGAGIFVVHVHIPTGRVQQVDVARTTGHKDLDAAAVTALKEWRFQAGVLPSTKKLHPEDPHPLSAEDSLVKVPVTFDIQ
jgi:TonB family protein